MIDIDATIDKAPPEYKNALKAEKIEFQGK